MLGDHVSRCHQDMEAAVSQPLTARQRVKKETGDLALQCTHLQEAPLVKQ